MKRPLSSVFRRVVALSTPIVAQLRTLAFACIVSSWQSRRRWSRNAGTTLARPGDGARVLPPVTCRAWYAEALVESSRLLHPFAWCALWASAAVRGVTRPLGSPARSLPTSTHASTPLIAYTLVLLRLPDHLCRRTTSSTLEKHQRCNIPNV